MTQIPTPTLDTQAPDLVAREHIRCFLEGAYLRLSIATKLIGTASATQPMFGSASS